MINIKAIKIITLVIIICSVVSGCSNSEMKMMNQKISDKNTQIENQSIKIDELDNEIITLQEEIDQLSRDLRISKNNSDSHKAFLNRLVATYTDKERDIFFRNLYVYNVTYFEDDNNKYEEIEFGAKPIYIESDNLSISILQRVFYIDELSEHKEEIRNAALGNNEKRYHENIELISDYKYEMTGTDGTVVTSIIYMYKNIGDDFKLEMKISDELAERIRADSKSIIFMKTKNKKEEIYGYIEGISLENNTITIDACEYLGGDDEERAFELGYNVESDFPNGFKIHNETEETIKYTVSNETKYIIYDYIEEYKEKEATLELLNDREKLRKRFYVFDIQGDEVIKVYEKYIP